MLNVLVRDFKGTSEFEHAEGPLVFGRRPDTEATAHAVVDPRISRNHLELLEVGGGRLQLRNLSRKNPVVLDGGRLLEALARCEVDLPANIRLGGSEIKVRVGLTTQGPGPAIDARTMIRQLGDSPDAQTLAQWFERVVHVQQAAAGSEQFLSETARAVVDLVGLDRGLVLLRADDDWNVVACERCEGHTDDLFSRSVLARMLEERCTYFENPGGSSPAASLAKIESVVAAPVLDKAGGVIGAVYGSRGERTESSFGIRPLEANLVQVLASAVGAGLIRQRKEGEVLRAEVRLEQAFSAPLARELARDPSLLEGRERTVTVLFSDVRRFTSTSERLGPRRIFQLMQDLMEMQSSHVLAMEGVVVDYYGDGMLAMWNAPTDQPDHAERACRAALAINGDLERLSETWGETLETPLAIGIGIHTGPALVGNTGSRVKVKYGPMGPTVNTASRVEGSVKQFGVPIVITGATRDALTASFGTRRLGRARLAGVAEPLELLELGGVRCAPEWEKARDRYESGLADFEAGRWEEACRASQELLDKEGWRRDAPTLNLLARAVECLRNAPTDFDPTYDFSRK